MLSKIQLNEDTTKDIYDLNNCGMYLLPEEFNFYRIDLHLKTGLDLSHNKLSSLKEGGNFSYLNEINSLNLSFNLFKNLEPDLFSNLNRLTVLNLQENGFKTLPAAIQNLKNLKKLNVSYNLLTSLPEELGNCQFLNFLDLKGNSNLHQLPFQLGKIGINLEELHLDASNFTEPSASFLAANSPFEVMKYLATKGFFQYATEKSHPKFIKQPEKSKLDDTADSNIEKMLRKMEQDKENELKLAQKLIEEQDQELKMLAEDVTNQHIEASNQAMQAIYNDDQETKKILQKQMKERENQLKDATAAIEIEQLNANKLMQRILAEQDIALPDILEKLTKIEKAEAAEFEKMLDSAEKLDVKALIESDLKENADMMKYLNNYMEDQNLINQDIMKQIDVENEYAADAMKKSDLEANLIVQNTLNLIAEDEAMQKQVLEAAIKSRDAEILKIEADISNIEKQLKIMTMMDINEKDLMVKDLLNNERVELANMIMVLNRQLDEREQQIKEQLEFIDRTEKEERMTYWLHMYREF